jgi:hypothetical protein
VGQTLKLPESQPVPIITTHPNGELHKSPINNTNTGASQIVAANNLIITQISQPIVMKLGIYITSPKTI